MLPATEIHHEAAIDGLDLEIARLDQSNRRPTDLHLDRAEHPVAIRPYLRGAVCYQMQFGHLSTEMPLNQIEYLAPGAIRVR